MAEPNLAGESSLFLSTYVPLFLSRYSLSYEQDCSCAEYFLRSRTKHKVISKNLIVSHEVFSKSLYVSKFYPEIYRELNCKYLSAACFYVMACHATGLFGLKDNCCVNLETQMDVFENFYRKLREFHFEICCNRPCDKVYIRGHYHSFQIGTDMIEARKKSVPC